MLSMPYTNRQKQMSKNGLQNKIMILENTGNTSKDWPAKKVTIFNTIVHLLKTPKNIVFFCLHFTRLCG